MNKIISVNHTKGGCGKTIISANLAAGLTIRGKKVLLVDTDLKAEATEYLLPEDLKVKHNIISLYAGTPLKMAIYQSMVPGLDIVPAAIDMSIEDLDTIENEMLGKPGGKVWLKKVINPSTTSNYDYVIIDTPPTFNVMGMNALSATSNLMIPVDGYFSMENIAPYFDKLAEFTEENNLDLAIDSIVMTNVEPRTLISKNIKAKLEEIYGGKVCKTYIPRSIKFAEAAHNKKIIYDYAPGSSASVQHMKLVDELLEKWENT